MIIYRKYMMNEKIKIKENKDLAYFANETPKIKMKYFFFHQTTFNRECFYKSCFKANLEE